MRKLARICTLLVCIVILGLTAQSSIWAKDIKLHDLNGSVVDTSRIQSFDPPRLSSDKKFWILTVYLESKAGPMAIIFQYSPDKRNLAQNDYEAIRRNRE